MIQEMAKRTIFISEIWKALGVEELADIVPLIMKFQTTATRLQVIEGQQAFLAQAQEILQQQLEGKKE